MIESVVIVDDEPADRYIAVRAIRKAGLDPEILECADGLDALDLIIASGRFPPGKIKPPDPPVLLLVDVNMPRMGGFEFLERLESAIEGGKICPCCLAVMMFTSSSNPIDRRRAASFSIVRGYIVKPLTPEELRRVLAECEKP